MTTAEAALRQLLADVEAVQAFLDNCDGEIPILMGSPKRRLAYLEKLARDGLVGPREGWVECPDPALECMHKNAGGIFDCSAAAKWIYGQNAHRCACEEHAVSMGAKAGM